MSASQFHKSPRCARRFSTGHGRARSDIQPSPQIVRQLARFDTARRSFFGGSTVARLPDRLDPNPPAHPQRSNPHNAWGPAPRSLSAVSSLGGFRTPALGARGSSTHRAGIRNPSQIRTNAANFKKVWRAGEVSTLASHGITPVEHDDDSEHRPGINDLRYVIQNNSDALSAGVPKFFMSVARQYRHQA